MRHSIWVVDDDKLVLGTLGTMLTELGHRVTLFENPEDALSRYKAARPDLVISDLRMPQMSGVELTRQLREKDHDAVIIILTGYPSISDAVDAIQAGAVDFIPKPCSFDELRVRIFSALNSSVLKKRLRHNRVLALTLLETLPVWVLLGMIASRFLR